MLSRWLKPALLVLALAAACPALIPADVLLQRNRASHVLKPDQREVAHHFAAEAAITTTPEEYRQRLAEAYPELSRARAFEFYAGVAHLERREKVLDAYIVRRDQTDKAAEALGPYLARCNERLRADDNSDIFTIRTWPGPEEAGPFEFTTGDKGLHVYHFLPWPEHLERSLAERALLLGEEDLKHCQDDKVQVEKARQDYLGAHVFWLRWLDRFGRQLSERTEGSLKAEVDPEQPPPPPPLPPLDH